EMMADRTHIQRGGSGWRALAGACVLYLGLALVYTWPLAISWWRAIPANGIGRLDGWQAAWHLWWTAQALAQGHNPYDTLLLFYPDGVNLFRQTLSAPLGVLMAPLTLSAGPVVAYNMALLLSFVLCGLFTYLLAYHLTGDTLAALVAGALF